jgi:hypothetical protein
MSVDSFYDCQGLVGKSSASFRLCVSGLLVSCILFCCVGAVNNFFFFFCNPLQKHMKCLKLFVIMELCLVLKILKD